MGKTKNTPPAFLQKRLDNKTFAFVKGNIKEFIAGERVKARGKGLPESPQLLRTFFVFLAFKSKKFQNIKPDALSTTYPGVGQIYDLIRKRNKPTNEESAALKIKEDLSGLLKEKKTDSKKVPASKDQDAVQVQANHDYGVKGDSAEKEVPYRKAIDDEAELSEPSNRSSENTSELPSEASSLSSVNKGNNIESGPHWYREKKFICQLLDQFTPEELREATFSLAVDGEAHQMTVTHLVANFNE